MNDFAQTNPPLHRLYVCWAMQHLIIIDKSLEKLYRSNFQWMEVRSALYQARTKLLCEEPAYQEAAWRILAGQSIREDENGAVFIYDIQADADIPCPESPAESHFILLSKDVTLDGILCKKGSRVSAILPSNLAVAPAAPETKPDADDLDKEEDLYLGDKPVNRSERQKQAIAERNDRGRTTKGRFGLWRPVRRGRKLIKGKYALVRAYATQSAAFQAIREDSLKSHRVSNPNGTWNSGA